MRASHSERERESELASFLSTKELQNPSQEGGQVATPIKAWWSKVMAGVTEDW